MKKHILIASFVLAFTFNSVLAKEVNVVTMKNGKMVEPLTKIEPSSNLINRNGFVDSNGPSFKMPKAEVRSLFEDRKSKEREKLYNDLNLTPEQKVKAVSLDAKTRIETSQYIRIAQREARKLRDLESKRASFFAIRKQKSALKKAKNDVDKYLDSSKKEFENILNDEQKAKLEEINAKKTKEMKNAPKHVGSGVYSKISPASK